MECFQEIEIKKTPIARKPTERLIIDGQSVLDRRLYVKGISVA
jgi:hypothetical protein